MGAVRLHDVDAPTVIQRRGGRHIAATGARLWARRFSSTHPCYAMLCYAMLCHAMLCYAMLCYAAPLLEQIAEAGDAEHALPRRERHAARGGRHLGQNGVLIHRHLGAGHASKRL